MEKLKLGDFTHLAKAYDARPAYDPGFVQSLVEQARVAANKPLRVADVGAGTGKLTKMLVDLGLETIAIEPNTAMRSEGMKYASSACWKSATGEATGLDSECVEWVTMASSFHWTNPQLSLPEFHRILSEGGCLTILWNPRNIDASPFHREIEDEIGKLVPNLKRFSSGAKAHTQDWEAILQSTGHFSQCRYGEVSYTERMSVERYLTIWNSVNDIRVQAGETTFNKIMKMLEEKVAHLPYIDVPYLNRAWTVRKIINS